MPGDATSLAPGFPIRTSSDPRSVDSSPRHIAASHVLHRLSVPRHPPCALKHLQHKKPKIFELTNSEIAHQTTKHTPAKPHKTGSHQSMPTCCLDARNHYPQIKHHTPPPKRGDNQVLSPVSHTGRRDSGPVASKPNSVSDDFLAPVFPLPAQRLLLHRSEHPLQVPAISISQPPNPHRREARGNESWCSLERR